ncbi:exopolysaccharide biosynthesis protein [Rhodobacteraceae bacterium NNCM2]|nr:exopolysaccharide biosynthesis protein [Coraliihabitans acroporae]
MTSTATSNSADQRDDDQETSLADVLDGLEDAGQEGGVSINDVLERFQGRSLGVWLTLFGLIAALPVIGAIPGVSILTGSLILIAIFQSFFTGGNLKVPGKVGSREIDQQDLSDAIEKARPWAERVDKVLSERLTLLTRGRGASVAIAVASALLAVSMYPLALIPWGVQAPATGIVAFGLALIARDGLFALLGYALSGLTLWLALTLL